MRNALEHIDEKIEDFTETPQMVLNKNIGAIRNFIQIGNDAYDPGKEKNLRHYDPEEKIYYFYGNSVNLEELYKVIKQLKESIENYEVINNDFYR